MLHKARLQRRTPVQVLSSNSLSHTPSNDSAREEVFGDDLVRLPAFNHQAIKGELEAHRVLEDHFVRHGKAALGEGGGGEKKGGRR